MNAAPQADYLGGISVYRAIVITHNLARHKQAAEFARDVQQILNVLLKSRAHIATYRKDLLTELVFFLTRLARRVLPIHFAVLMEFQMGNHATTTATRLPKKTVLV